VGRDAIRQFQKRFEPDLLGFAILLDFGPVLGATNKGADGNGDDVDELVADVVLSWIGDVYKVSADGEVVFSIGYFIRRHLLLYRLVTQPRKENNGILAIMLHHQRGAIALAQNTFVLDEKREL
jgi:hypothetical protein